MVKFRFGILGASNIANKFCNAVNKIDNCEIIAVASKNEERARQFAQKNNIIHYYDSYVQMLDIEHPDCVYISVTVNDHYRLTMLCIERGIPVLCEKAMFQNSRQAKIALQRAKDLDVFAMEAMWSRFLPAVKKVKEWIKNEKIGTIELVQTTLGFIAPVDFENRYYSSQLGGGVARDLTVYAYEILTFLLDQQIRNMTVSAKWSESGVDITNHITLSFENTLVSLMTTFVSKVEEKMILYGREGKIILPFPHFAEECFLYNREGILIDHFKDSKTENGFTYEIREVMHCIQKGSIESPIIPHKDTIACAELFDIIDATNENSVLNI